MPKVSKQSAAHVEQYGPVEDRHEDVHGYTIDFLSFSEDIDATPLMTGLPERQLLRARTGATCSRAA